MNAENWSDRDNDAVVTVHFQMLMDDLAGRAYNKAMNNIGFSAVPWSIQGLDEFKSYKISVAMIGFRLPYIRGYQPRSIFRCNWRRPFRGSSRSLREATNLYPCCRATFHEATGNHTFHW